MNVMTQPQHLVALAKANKIRADKSKLKRELLGMDRAASRACACGLLVDPPHTVLRMDVSELLFSIRGFGNTRVKRILQVAGISGWRKVESLTDRQRGLLASLVRDQ